MVANTGGGSSGVEISDASASSGASSAKITMARILSVPGELCDSNPKRSGVPKASESVHEVVQSVVQSLGGDKPVHSVLVANNGNAATKFIRSVRSWAYKTFGSEQAIVLVAMATPEDMKADAEHIRLADQFVEVPGGSNNNNYANVSLILQIAKRAGVEAVWPGWGHASENPDLPSALEEAGIRFLGPGPAAMAALGDKVGSTILAQAAGVPTLPWSGTGVSISFKDCGGVVPSDVYQQACVNNVEDAVVSCSRVGYPVMLKASWGGGGKGIRKCMNDDEVRAVFKQVQGEVPGSPIFVMKLAPPSRHLEVQLVADAYGNVASIHSRDCSVQRRHQKIVEEGPITAAPPETVKEMERCARSLARAVGYVGAATVEYLYSLDDGGYYFLELNPRLQVEHPVTEWISGVNLPATQLQIGMGIPLHRIPDIRRLFGKEATGTDHIDFEGDSQVAPNGHVVAVRVTSEDAHDGFKPTTGKIDEINFRSTPDVWGYFSIKAGGRIHEFSDSQFGHLFAKGDNRTAAIRSMVVALRELRIRGEIRTIVDYCTHMIQDEDFLGNNIHTGWLDNRIAAQLTTGKVPWDLAVVCGAVLNAMDTVSANSAEYVSYLEKGQIPPSTMSMTTFDLDIVLDGVKYPIHTVRRGTDYFRVTVGGSHVDAVARRLGDGGLLVQVDGASHVVHSEQEVGGLRLLVDTGTCLLANEHDPSKVLALSAGKLIRYLVDHNDHVDQDQPYAEVEVMKMVMPLLAPAPGKVHFLIPEGGILNAGDLIATLSLDDPSAVRRAQPFKGSLPSLGAPQIESQRVDHRFQAARQAAEAVLAGYDRSVEQVVRKMLTCLKDPTLPLLQWSECFSVVSGRVGASLEEDLAGPLEAYAKAIEAEMNDGVSIAATSEAGQILAGGEASFPSSEILEIMQAYLSKLPESEQMAQQAVLEPLMQLAQSHAGGIDCYAQHVVSSLFDQYLTVEEAMETDGTEGIDQLRQQNAENLQNVLDIVVSHQGLKRKVALVLNLMAAVVARCPEKYRSSLRRLANLRGRGTADAVRKAQQLLEQSMRADLRAVVLRGLEGNDMNLEEAIETAENESSATKTASDPAVGRRDTLADGMFDGLEDRPGTESIEGRIAMLVEAPAAVSDVLASLLQHQDPKIQRRALSTYIQRTHFPFMVADPIIHESTNGLLTAVWHFTDPATAGMRNVKQCAGAAALIHSLSQVPEALEAVREPLTQMGSFIAGGITLQLVLIGRGTDTLSLTKGAEELYNDSNDAGSPVSAMMTRTDSFNIATNPGVIVNTVSSAVAAEAATLRKLGITSATCLTFPSSATLGRHGFRLCEASGKYRPCWQLSNLELAQTEVLELWRLQDLSANVITHEPSRNRQFHIFTVLEATGQRSPQLRRVFVRGVVRRLGRPALLAATYSSNAAATAAAAVEELEEYLVGYLAEMRRRDAAPAASPADWAHIFLTVLPPLPLHAGKDRAKVAAALKAKFASLALRQGAAARSAAVTTLEVRFRVQDAAGAWRVVVSTPTGHESGEEHVEVFLEQPLDSPADPTTGGSEGQGFTYLTGTGGRVVAPYGRLEPLQQKRLAARRHKTTYCYDFPAVFENALRLTWAERAAAGEPDAVPPMGKLVDATELVPSTGGGQRFDGDMILDHCKREPGQNRVGMVAWLLQLKTPECPAGRQAVAIANDITYASGSFGPAEDGVFRAATEYALAERLPVIYLAANSGARVGLASEVKDCVQVAWINPEEPSKGYEYLYLSDSDYQRICSAVPKGSPKPVRASRIIGKQGDPVWVLSDVVGSEDGLGVECLSGSGAIASVYSRAWDEGFTVTLVSGKAVGIGAYLARLGRRVIQRSDQPVILTGYAALNKVLGREVYTSHNQLGGPKVMGVNGVSHHVVADDLEGAVAILRWLSYAAPELGVSRPLPMPTADPLTRGVGYTVHGKLDPRAAIAGEVGTDGDWKSGLFDRGSWVEAQAGWARTVVTGRARLGGHPVGVIAVETQTIMNHIPADPGMPDSSERIIPQAGQVWYPDSAAKTAQAMEEFNREGLPLFILANWRGFSGGQRDLFEGVLQMGALIVEQLRCYRHSVFVYMPPGAELRGGAWAVIDSQINKNQIEMYADPTARGGVLEPEGMVEIKFRTPDVKKMMHRLDPELVSLKASNALDVDATVRARENQLLPMYHQLAVKFAELHDTPVRMAAKGVLRGVVPWHKARAFFTARLTRRLLQESLQGHICSADSVISMKEAGEMLQKWFLSSNQRFTSGGPSHDEVELATPSGDMGAEATAFLRWARDSEFMEWAESASGAQRIATELKSLRASSAERSISGISATQEGKEGLLRGLAAAMQTDPILALQLRALLH